MKFFSKKHAPADDTEPFVTLMRVAQEDAEIRRQLIGILSLDEFNRTSLLNSQIEEMRLAGAPQELIIAVACLLKEDVAQKALAFLTSCP